MKMNKTNVAKVLSVGMAIAFTSIDHVLIMLSQHIPLLGFTHMIVSFVKVQLPFDEVVQRVHADITNVIALLPPIHLNYSTVQCATYSFGSGCWHITTPR